MTEQDAASELKALSREHMRLVWQIAQMGGEQLNDDDRRTAAAMAEHPEYAHLWDRLDRLALLLEGNRLPRADYPTPGKVHEIWSHVNFPLFYQADIPFVLHVAAELGALDHPGASPALAWLAALRRDDGVWHGTSPFRTPRGLWDHGEIDRWVTLHAASVLDAAAAAP